MHTYSWSDDSRRTRWRRHWCVRRRSRLRIAIPRSYSSFGTCCSWWCGEDSGCWCSGGGDGCCDTSGCCRISVGEGCWGNLGAAVVPPVAVVIEAAVFVAAAAEFPVDVAVVAVDVAAQSFRREKIMNQWKRLSLEYIILIRFLLSSVARKWILIAFRWMPAWLEPHFSR